MEKYTRKKQSEEPGTGAVSFRPVLVALLLTALIFYFQKNLTTPELIVLQLKLIIAWATLLYAVSKVPSPKKLKPVVPAVFFLCLLMMSQALPEKTKDSLPRFQHNFSVSGTSANIGVTGYKCIKVEQGCLGDNYCALADTAHAIGPAYQNINIGYDFLGQITERSSLAFNLGYRFDRLYNERANFTSNSKHFFFSTGLEGRKHIGFRLGIRVGDIFFYEEDGKNRFFKKAVGMGSIWFGHKDYLTGHFGFSDGPMNITPAVSSGYLKANLKMLGTKYPDQLIFGSSDFSGEFSTTYVGFEKYIGPHFRIEPYYGWTRGVDKSQRHNFQLKLSYQFFKK